MTSSNANEAVQAPTPDLSGVRVLVVEDSWQLGVALKSLLQALGAKVSGPVATAADAARLSTADAPDVALVDFNLRGGERADGLIDQLSDQGVEVIVTSGYAALPVTPKKPTAVLQKPISEAQLLACLHLVAARKAAH
jgi:CheY-like chemotaxis protein